MRKRISFFFLLAVTSCLLFVGCSKQKEQKDIEEINNNVSENITDQKQQASDEVNEIAEDGLTVKDNSDNEIPLAVESIYNFYSANSIEMSSDSGNYIMPYQPVQGLSLGDYDSYYIYLAVIDSNDANIVVDKSNLSKVYLFVENDEIVSIEVQLALSEGNDVIKEEIVLTFMVFDDLSYTDATTEMQELVNSYSEDKNSKTIKLNTYHYMLEAKNSVFDYYSLDVVENSSVDFDKTSYVEADNGFLQSPLNQGEHCCLTGIVLSDVEGTYNNTLEITSDNGKYLIFYNAKNFNGEFEIGQEYTFYGDVAKCRDDYDGCVRIDYYENTSDDSDETIEENNDEVYLNETDFEAALNSGADGIGATVTFTVDSLHPDSGFGYDLWTGEHLNFVSEEDPNLKEGETITVRVTDVKSVFDSWIIYYIKL